jgi:hypothetical protein
VIIDAAKGLQNTVKILAYLRRNDDSIIIHQFSQRDKVDVLFFDHLPILVTI